MEKNGGGLAGLTTLGWHPYRSARQYGWFQVAHGGAGAPWPPRAPARVFSWCQIHTWILSAEMCAQACTRLWPHFLRCIVLQCLCHAVCVFIAVVFLQEDPCVHRPLFVCSCSTPPHSSVPLTPSISHTHRRVVRTRGSISGYHHARPNAPHRPQTRNPSRGRLLRSHVVRPRGHWGLVCQSPRCRLALRLQVLFCLFWSICQPV